MLVNMTSQLTCKADVWTFDCTLGFHSRSNHKMTKGKLDWGTDGLHPTFLGELALFLCRCFHISKHESKAFSSPFWHIQTSLLSLSAYAGVFIYRGK